MTDKYKDKLVKLEVSDDVPIELPLIYADYKKLAEKINELIGYIMALEE